MNNPLKNLKAVAMTEAESNHNWYAEACKEDAPKVGDVRTITNDLPAGWFTRPGYKPTETLTVTVSKIFKNGKVAASVKELHGKTINFLATDF